jgi:hypothetical protein
MAPPNPPTPPIPPPPPRPEPRQRFSSPQGASRTRRTTLDPSQNRVAGNCDAIDPVGRQCQLPGEHEGSHRVRYPGNRGPYMYTWGDVYDN